MAVVLKFRVIEHAFRYVLSAPANQDVRKTRAASVHPLLHTLNPVTMRGEQWHPRLSKSIYVDLDAQSRLNACRSNTVREGGAGTGGRARAHPDSFEDVDFVRGEGQLGAKMLWAMHVNSHRFDP